MQTKMLWTHDDKEYIFLSASLYFWSVDCELEIQFHLNKFVHNLKSITPLGPHF